MHFDDLSSYCYELACPLDGVRNVGWLWKGFDYPSGSAPSSLIEALKRWAKFATANRMRGYELCRFCQHDGYKQMSTFYDGQDIMLGAAEIWMPDDQGGIFVSPDLIIHYVENHSYRPPAEFIKAALKPIPHDWNAEKVAERCRIEQK